MAAPTGSAFATVAARTGLTKPTVFHYFPNKNALLGAVFDALGERLQGAAENWFDPPPASYTERLEQLIGALVEFYGRDPLNARILCHGLLEAERWRRGAPPGARRRRCSIISSAASSLRRRRRGRPASSTTIGRWRSSWRSVASCCSSSCCRTAAHVPQRASVWRLWTSAPSKCAADSPRGREKRSARGAAAARTGAAAVPTPPHRRGEDREVNEDHRRRLDT
jgi:AcrR family transcriptional regulator